MHSVLNLHIQTLKGVVLLAKCGTEAFRECLLSPLLPTNLFINKPGTWQVESSICHVDKYCLIVYCFPPIILPVHIHQFYMFLQSALF